MDSNTVEMVFINVQSCKLNDDGEWEVKALIQEKALHEGDEEWKEATLETFAHDKDFSKAHSQAVESLMMELINVIGDRDVSLLEALSDDDVKEDKAN